jgi:hypothetical protein
VKTTCVTVHESRIVTAARPRLSSLLDAALASLSNPAMAMKLAVIARRMMIRITTRLSSWRAALARMISPLQVIITLKASAT